MSKKNIFLWTSDKPAFSFLPPWARKTLAFAAIAYLLACLGIYALQRSMLFHPPAQTAPPGPAWAQSGDARFWIFKPAPSDAPSLCPASTKGTSGAVAYFGGNAERARDFERHLAQFPGCTAYALSYPGYEGAPGDPSEDSIHNAADLMIERMKADGVDMAQALFIGRSLGSGEAARQASKEECRLALLATPYDSLADVAQGKFPWAPTAFLMRDPFDAKPWAKSARCSAVIVFADPDSVIPGHHALNLSNAWNPKKSTIVSTNPKATHANILELPGTWSEMRRALAAPGASKISTVH